MLLGARLPIRSSGAEIQALVGVKAKANEKLRGAGFIPGAPPTLSYLQFS